MQNFLVISTLGGGLLSVSTSTAAVPVGVDVLAALSQRAGLPRSSGATLAADGWDPSSLHLATVDDLRRLGFNTASARKLMAAAARTPTGPSLNVLDFGADPSSHNDSTVGFNAAFAHAQTLAYGLAGGAFYVPAIFVPAGCAQYFCSPTLPPLTADSDTDEHPSCWPAWFHHRCRLTLRVLRAATTQEVHHYRSDQHL